MVERIEIFLARKVGLAPFGMSAQLLLPLAQNKQRVAPRPCPVQTVFCRFFREHGNSAIGGLGSLDHVLIGERPDI
ncbi:hypothetical protein GCM10011488_09710 [Steroidobacter agaridevorans]|nr:hypothetical protein GCM10011488_09710 [Steroidobacter agaridevorans]